MRYIDTHTHLDFAAFDPDRDAVLDDCLQLGVERLVVLGVAVSNWQKVWQLTQQQPMLHAAFGLHPMFCAEHQPQHLDQLRQQLQNCSGHRQLCAVGEFGLDFYLDNTDRDAQQQLFEQQLALAADFSLPVLLHVRRAHAQCIATLKRFKLQRSGIIHAFSGSLEEAQEYLKLGFKLGIGGAATWPQAKRMHRTIAQLPANSIVLETDSPDMPPSFAVSQRNSPQNIPAIARHLAELRKQPVQQFAEQCWHNSCELFDWATTPVS
ncbi:TatD family deoxyribonuclease [Pseudomonas neustonica]|uniref:TatD family deoxyribonuclease n=1 Tax=Pseudomonas neustonica TaxID=2487346 RepID=A0ABX9XL20_9PSED|nr:MULTISPECIES: TatD family hydrolase [Pseudomonas]ROZ85575.1 TatD family deoxyribonuclease [Pseudomonas sp. SSM44]ROZ87531.1 TatD family deoxyribonuclease [Pseudomonas neustonica]|tara:strand:- start:516 stop:1310 length:795 start_codon:yes stop_codon:yes gene_type:complete